MAKLSRPPADQRPVGKEGAVVKGTSGNLGDWEGRVPKGDEGERRHLARFSTQIVGVVCSESAKRSESPAEEKKKKKRKKNEPREERFCVFEEFIFRKEKKNLPPDPGIGEEGAVVRKSSCDRSG